MLDGSQSAWHETARVYLTVGIDIPGCRSRAFISLYCKRDAIDLSVPIYCFFFNNAVRQQSVDSTRWKYFNATVTRCSDRKINKPRLVRLYHYVVFAHMTQTTVILLTPRNFNAQVVQTITIVLFLWDIV